MEQQVQFCPLAQHMLNAATTVQVLTEGGYRLLGVRIHDKDSVIQIAYSPKNKLLNGKSAGKTYWNNAIYYVYQVDINGALVRWLEPFHNAIASAKVH